MHGPHAFGSYAAAVYFGDREMVVPRQVTVDPAGGSVEEVRAVLGLGAFSITLRPDTTPILNIDTWHVGATGAVIASDPQFPLESRLSLVNEGIPLDPAELMRVVVIADHYQWTDFDNTIANVIAAAQALRDEDRDLAQLALASLPYEGDLDELLRRATQRVTP